MENAFQTLGLKDSLVQGVRELGFTDPTPIQLQVIPKLLHSPRDIIALAPTGTGKTAAFGLPILQRLDPELRHVQALVLSPTRELCVQIGKDLQDLGSQLPFLRVVPLYGGAGIGGQIGKLEKHPQVAVATPGRLLDLLRRKKIDLSKIGTLVLDEADEMLKMGFAEDLAAIAAFTPEGRQTLLFSATLPKEVEVLSGQYLKNPEVITLGRRNAGVETVEHHFCVLEEKNRYEGLRRILDLQPEMYAIIFCRTRLETQELSLRLAEDGYNVDALHGDLSQDRRDEVMASFRSRIVRILTATDVAARGLDIDDLTHIIHYRLPDEPEGYVHRSGRTGRAGKQGVSISLINVRERRKLRYIEEIVGRPFFPGLPQREGDCGRPDPVPRATSPERRHGEPSRWVFDGCPYEGVRRRKQGGGPPPLRRPYLQPLLHLLQRCSGPGNPQEGSPPAGGRGEDLSPEGKGRVFPPHHLQGAQAEDDPYGSYRNGQRRLREEGYRRWGHHDSRFLDGV